LFFDPENPGPVQRTLILNIISGWQFPKTGGKENKEKGEVIDPFVQVKLAGVSKDKNDWKTKTVKNNGFNPLWNTEIKIPLTCPDLAVLLFTVWNEDLVAKNYFIAQYALDVTNVREGYRVVPLKDKKGHEYEKASLLIHFVWEDSESKASESLKKESFLLKKGSSPLTNKWNQRWCVLQNSEIKYYKNQNDLKKSKGIVHVKGQVCGPIKSADTNFENTFVIVTRQRNWYFKTQSVAELREWKRALLLQGAKWQPKAGSSFAIAANGSVKQSKK